MKVATTKNVSKPSELTYSEVDVTGTIKTDDYTFAVHRSYNPLFDCYMVSEYLTGYVITTFSIQNGSEPSLKDIMERAEKVVENINVSELDETLKKVPEINEELYTDEEK